MEFSEELVSCFEEIKGGANSALGHYQVWFTLTGKEKGWDLYIKDMGDYRYQDYFRATFRAHYISMFIELVCLFDTDKKSNRMKRLKTLMEQNGLKILADEFKENLSPYRPLVKNLITVRSKIIAHKEIDASPHELYQKHQITPDEIKNLLHTVVNLLERLGSILYHNASYNGVGITDRWEKSTFNLLKAINKSRHSQ